MGPWLLRVTATAIGMAMSAGVMLGAAYVLPWDSLLPTTAAQEDAPESSADPISVTVGERIYMVDGSEPLAACVYEVRQEFQGVWVRADILWREPSGEYTPLGERQTRQTGGFVGVNVGGCVYAGGS